MPSYIEKIEEITLPIIALRGTVAFPAVPVNFEITDDESAKAAKVAGGSNSYIFLTSFNETPSAEEKESGFPFFHIGTVAKIKQMIRTPEGNTRIVAEGFLRASVVKYRHTDGGYVEAELLCKSIFLPDKGGGIFQE